jgi:hypothetical protein
MNRGMQNIILRPENLQNHTSKNNLEGDNPAFMGYFFAFLAPNSDWD